jgi:hypothetical protein
MYSERSSDPEWGLRDVFKIVVGAGVIVEV